MCLFAQTQQSMVPTITENSYSHKRHSVSCHLATEKTIIKSRYSTGVSSSVMCGTSFAAEPFLCFHDGNIDRRTGINMYSDQQDVILKKWTGHRKYEPDTAQSFGKHRVRCYGNTMESFHIHGHHREHSTNMKRLLILSRLGITTEIIQGLNIKSTHERQHMKV